MVGEGSIKAGIDEALIAVIGLGAAAWYWRCRYVRSLLPLAFVGVDLLLKIVALVIEDPDDRGDDVGSLMLLVVLAVTWTIVSVRSRLAAAPTAVRT